MQVPLENNIPAYYILHYMYLGTTSSEFLLYNYTARVPISHVLMKEKKIHFLSKYKASPKSI